ncbi:hypothetical protein [Nesterenkonia halotolerans]|uniref:Uncharacterized protein n=1 Tax=Nesterenkonia halotolerans TaxID=225325 RepID=A0ABR9J908_9MICC|nr:hypothetical protein [Nesterenkonia halotolerans]MBE1515481.1 hypothetical protein [Nesterenkonia halotolerans]
MIDSCCTLAALMTQGWNGKETMHKESFTAAYLALAALLNVGVFCLAWDVFDVFGNAMPPTLSDTVIGASLASLLATAWASTPRVLKNSLRLSNMILGVIAASMTVPGEFALRSGVDGNYGAALVAVLGVALHLLLAASLATQSVVCMSGGAQRPDV